jgi:hypothetical protein
MKLFLGFEKSERCLVKIVPSASKA